MKIKKIEQILVATFFAIIIVIFFNEPINQYIGLQTSSEITLLLEISAMIIFIAMLILVPLGMGTEESGE